MRVVKCADEPFQIAPKIVDIFLGLGQIIGKIDFRFLHPPEFVDRELKTILVFVDESFDFQEIILLEDVDKFFDVVPHLRFDVTAAVAESERKVRFTSLLGFHLLGNNNKDRRDDLVLLLRTVANKEFFHEPR